MSVEATLATWRLSKKLVTSTEKLFLLSCADRAGEGAECWPSIKRLCADTGLDRKTVIDVRQSVIDKGLMIYTGEMRGRTKSVPVMALTYVTERAVDEELSRSSPKNGTGSSPKNGTAKQSQKRDTEPKRIEPKRVSSISSDFDPNISASKDAKKLFLEPFIRIWNEKTKKLGCKPVGKDKRVLNEIRRHLKSIQENWERELTPENFEIWLDNSIKAEYFLITKYLNPMNVCIRLKNFLEAYDLAK